MPYQSFQFILVYSVVLLNIEAVQLEIDFIDTETFFDTMIYQLCNAHGFVVRNNLIFDMENRLNFGQKSSKWPFDVLMKN